MKGILALQQLIQLVAFLRYGTGGAGLAFLQLFNAHIRRLDDVNRRALESVSEDDPNAALVSTVPEVDSDVDTVCSNTAAAASVVDVTAGGIDASVYTTDVAFDIAVQVLICNMVRALL